MKNYSPSPEGTSTTFSFDRSFFEGLARRIWGEEINPRNEIDREAWQAFLDTFNKATDEGFGTVPEASPQWPFYKELRYNNGVFAAFRQHAMQHEIAAQILDENGELKSFDEFYRNVKTLEPAWLDSWLRTEYDTAVHRAHLAAQWRQFEENKDILPNLRWIPTTSPNPGPDHEVFWDVIRSIDDPFWDEHRPGDRWNCKCGLEATDRAVTLIPGAGPEDKPSPGLKNNPGKDAQLFDKKHPYIKDAAPGAKGAVARFLEENLPKPEEITEKRYKSGGLIQIQGEQNKIEAKKNLEAYTYLAKNYGDQYRLLPVDNTPNVKNPDALNLITGLFSDAKVPMTANGKNAIQQSIKAASRQGISEVLIYLEKEYNLYDIRLGIIAALQKGRASSVQTIIIKRKDGEVMRYKVNKLRKVIK